MPKWVRTGHRPRKQPAPKAIRPVRVKAPPTRLIGTQPALIVALLGAGLVALGSILPWATVNAGIFSVTTNGTEGDGQFTLVFGLGSVIVLLLIWLAQMRRGPRTVLLILCVLAACLSFLAGVSDAHDVSGKSAGPVHATVGSGLWLVIIGGAICAVASVVQTQQKPVA